MAFEMDFSVFKDWIYDARLFFNLKLLLITIADASLIATAHVTVFTLNNTAICLLIFQKIELIFI